MEDLTPTDSEKDYLQREASLTRLYTARVVANAKNNVLAKLPIPDLMRAYMYTYGYRKPSMAQELIVSLGLPSHVCEDCGECPSEMYEWMEHCNQDSGCCSSQRCSTGIYCIINSS